MDDAALRIAVEGCGHGTLNAIYASINKTCETHGWDGIDLLIIGGDFQAVRNSYDLNCMSVPMKFREIGDFHEYYSGSRKAPYLTIFIGGNHEASNYLFELYYGGWVAPNIYYLGAANVICLGPLRIASLSGIWKGYNYQKPHHERLPYSQNDIKSIYHVREVDVRKLMQIRTQLDIGISHDWPRGVEWNGNWKALFAKKDLFEADARAGTLGSVAAKYVMDRLRPTYWFSAHLHCKFSAIIDYQNQQSSISTGSQFKNERHVSGETVRITDDQYGRDLLPINHEAPLHNEDEIMVDVEIEDDVPIAPGPNQSPTLNITVQITAASETVSEDLRAQLPTSFQRPVAPPASIPFPPPTAITNRTTNFLALDKCLPNRKFLQILCITPTAHSGPLDVPHQRPYRLSYDKEWLAITRVFSSELTLNSPSIPVPPDQGEAVYRASIKLEETWVQENVVAPGRMVIPPNFERTAPIFDEGIPITNREQPREYTNLQTTAYCELLSIPNLFDVSEEERTERMIKGPVEEVPRMVGMAPRENKKWWTDGGRGSGGGGRRWGGGRSRGRGRY